MTHEQFIEGIRKMVADRVHPDIQARILPAKLTYGVGDTGIRGTTYYEAWQTGETRTCFVGIHATGEESVTQLAGTTIHELGHVLAGSRAGHSSVWKDACHTLGLVNAEAAGQVYSPDHFDGKLWAEIVAFGVPQDGNPAFSGVGSGIPFHGIPKGAFKPCPLGMGTRGGKSRGVGSGSRLRLYTCQCVPDKVTGLTNKARVASDTFDATCNRCKAVFMPERPGKVGAA